MPTSLCFRFGSFSLFRNSASWTSVMATVDCSSTANEAAAATTTLKGHLHAFFDRVQPGAPSVVGERAL